MHDLDETRRDEALRDPLPLEEVERLVELVRETGVGEVRVRQGDVEISVKAAAEPQAPQRAETRPAREEEPPAEPATDSPERDGTHAIRSPLVGTFYRAPAPGDEPYVEVGDRIRAGEILCIVEAMKLMNEIPADVSGEVVEILAENASGVEYDQPLFRLRPEE
ncbi:MAG TPA: acetyl-CoA carboxylase biotin carboxyl carrier protein [Rubrobacteraceae bacterium]|nr:acetyl-CoA carboxylase biotin carboxyl carrier protein [Rubrobacteraceae bacterium]